MLSDDQTSSWKYDVAVIGTGRVGLPLALSFAQRGLNVLGIDNNPQLLQSLAERRMPFQEAGGQQLLESVLESGRYQTSNSIEDACQAKHIVITLGTPSFSHIEIDVTAIREALDQLLPSLRNGHTLILRSTVAPGTTEFVAGYLEQRSSLKVGETLFVAHAPERIAAGKFLVEIDSLPCIIGGIDQRSGEKTAELFSVFKAPVRQTTPVEAELTKIWTNILRYTQFALPNLLMQECERYGANVFDVIDMVNRDYPRGGLAQPGMTAGTCLRKDFAFSEENSPAPTMLLGASRVNESVPLFLVNGVKSRIGQLRDRKVAVLGLTFKRDCDDERDSLAFKLIRILERSLATVTVHDPFAHSETDPLQETLRDADAVIIATDHSVFAEDKTMAAIQQLTAKDCVIADPWNLLKSGSVFTNKERKD